MPRAKPRVRKPTPRIPKLLPNELERKGLLKQVQGVPDCRAVVLLAPSGYGKSTTLAQLARASKRVVVWVLLTPDDASVLGLVRVVLAELERMLQGVFVPNATKTALEAQASAEGLGRALAQDLNNLELGNQTVDLVLDRTEVLSPAVSGFLEVLLEQLGEGHRVLLAGFASSSLPLARWAARADVLVFAAEQLRFTEAETKAFVAGQLQEAAIDQYAGFPAALALAVQQDNGLTSPQSLILERLGRLPIGIQEKLPPLAVLDVWSADSSAFLGLELPKGFFEQLLAAGLPLVPVSAAVFQPHQLLLGVLAERLAGSEQHTKIRLLAGRKCFAESKPLMAFEHFRVANKWLEAIWTLENSVPELIQIQEYSLAMIILQKVPTELLTEKLVAYLGYCCLVTGAIAAARPLIDKLSADTCQSALGKVTVAHFENFHMRFQEALLSVEVGLGLIISSKEEFELCNVGFFSLNSMQRYSEALAYVQRMLVIAEEMNIEVHIAQSWAALGSVYGEMKKVQEADFAFSKAAKIYEHLGGIKARLGLYNNWADVALTNGRIQVALDCVKQGLRLQGTVNDHFSIYLLGQQGLIFYASNKPHKAIESFRQSLELIRQTAFEYADLHRASLTQLLALTGNFAEAKQHLAEFKLQTSSPDSGDVLFTEAILAFCQKEFQLALEFFQQAIPKGLFSWDEARAQMLAAACQLALGQDTALSVAAAFAKIDESVQHDTPLLSDFLVLEGFYRQHLLPNPVFTQRIQNLISLLETVSVERDTRPVLKVNSLGEFNAWLDGKPIEIPLTKSKELLVFLLAHGSSPQREIIGAVWEKTKQAADYFRVAIRKLRVALTSAGLDFDPFPLMDGLYRVSEHLKIEWDVQVLEAALQNSKTTFIELTSTQAGEFLPFAETEWAMQLRLRLHDGLLTRILAIAQSSEITDPTLSLEAYQTALKLEPLTEEAYAGLHRLAAARGDHAEAVHVQLRQAREIQHNLN